MKQYHNFLTHILHNGTDKSDRTGIGTISTFGYQMRFDLSKGFPAVTTKKLAWKAVVSELLWFLEGSTDERRLCEILHGTRDKTKTTIWTENANAQGVALGYRNDADVKELGPVYGHQWRDFGGVDQIEQLIANIKSDPYSRRHIVSAWNVPEISKMALPPCHLLFQFYVNDNKLSCMFMLRSSDAFLGMPFNIASYALLTHMIAQVCNLEVGELVVTVGDAHIYSNSVDAVNEQLSREELALPTLWLNPAIKDIGQFTMKDIKLIGYESHGPLKVPMAV